MDLELTAEQQELESIGLAMLDRHAPLSLARSLLDGDGDVSPLWKLVAELGWYGAGLDGDVFGVPGLCLLARESGAHAAPLPLVETAVAARLAGALGGRAGEAVSGLLEGERSAAVAALEPSVDWTLRGVRTTATPLDGGGWRLSGTKVGVAYGAHADLVAVLADVAGSPAVFFVAAGTEGVQAQPDGGMDAARLSVQLTLTDVVVRADAAVSQLDAALLAEALALGAVASAAEGLGAATRALDLAIEYARERRQFGRPIGQFQALQHVIADAHVERETAWSTVLHAAGALDERTADSLEAAAVAKAHASAAMRTVVEAALQVLGGIAFTWEHDVHLLQRRVLDCERRFGDAIHHERVLGDLLAGDRQMVGT